MKEQKVVQSTRDHKLQHEQIQQQSVGMTILGCLAEINRQEALQQAVQQTTGELSTRRLFKYGDVEEKPQRQEQQLLLEAEAEKLRGNDFTKEMKEHMAQLTAKQPAAQLTKEAAKQQALGMASAEEQGEAAEQPGRRRSSKRDNTKTKNSRQSRLIASTLILMQQRSCRRKRSECRTKRINCASSWQMPSPRS